MINIGIAGLGKMGKLHFLNSLKIKDVKINAIADLSRSRRKSAEKFGVKTYSDYKDMIDTENIDAIIISLPNFLKKESVLYAIDKSIDVFLDKPLARNYDEAEEMVSRANDKNIRLMVGTNYRYFDSVQKLKSKIDDGNIGEVQLLTSELIMDGPFSHPLVPAPVADWWFDKNRSGGGALLDLGYHLLDLFVWMFGDYDVEYSLLKNRYNLPIEDSATLVLKSKMSDITGVINVGWFSKMVFPAFNFRCNAHGSVGYISTDKYAPRNPYLHAMKSGIDNLFRKLTGRNLNYLSYTYYYSSFVNILSLFFDCITKGSEIESSLKDQLIIMKSIDDVYNKIG